MTAGTVKQSPVIVVKKKRQIAPVTENVPATPYRENSPSAARSFLSSGLKTTLSALLRSVFSVMPKPLLTKTLTAVSHFSTVAAFSPGLLRHYPISVSLPPAPFVTACTPALSLKGTSSTHARPVNVFSVFSNKKRLRHN